MIRLLITLILISLAAPALAQETTQHDITIISGQPWIFSIVKPGVCTIPQNGVFVAEVFCGGIDATAINVEQSKVVPGALILQLTRQQTARMKGMSCSWTVVRYPDLGGIEILVTGKTIVRDK